MQKQNKALMLEIKRLKTENKGQWPNLEYLFEIEKTCQDHK
jgi:hypothetical protein